MELSLTFIGSDYTNLFIRLHFPVSVEDNQITCCKIYPSKIIATCEITPFTPRRVTL